jgi:membrane protease YdiL (CAAX protease family)
MVVRYRLRMQPLTRILRTVLLATLGLMFLPAVVTAGVDVQWRTLSIVGLLSSIYGLRIVLGPAVEVRPTGLRVFKHWPWRREIPWYRIFQVEVVPGYWVLDLELNSGEQLELPCVEHVDDLFERIEEHRARLDLDA